MVRWAWSLSFKFRELSVRYARPLGLTTGRGLWITWDLGFSSDGDGGRDDGDGSMCPRWDRPHGPDSPPASIVTLTPAK